MPAGDWIAIAAIGATIGTAIAGASIRISVRLGSIQQQLADMTRRLTVLELRMDNRKPRRYHEP